MKNTPLIFSELAKYYDLIYSFKNYPEEVNKLLTLINQFKQSTGNNLLDVACGTGKHLQFLKESFDCIGTDINESMLEIAKLKLPTIDFKKENMISMRLNQKFDVITCLFTAIGYVKTRENLQKAIKTFALHLKPGGIVIIEPWFTQETYKVGTPWMTTYSDDDTKIARLSIHKLEKKLSIIDFHYLIAERDNHVKSFIDRHELGLFEINETLEIMRKMKFSAFYLEKNTWEDNRGIYIGVYENS